MLDPQEIVDDIEFGFRIGNMVLQLYVDVMILPEDIKWPAQVKRFDDPVELAPFLFDLSFTKRILEFRAVRDETGAERSVSGDCFPVVGYAITVGCPIGNKTTGTNITAEVVAELCEVLRTDKYIEHGWLSEDDLMKEGESEEDDS